MQLDLLYTALRDKVNSDNTMNLLKAEIGINHVIYLNHVV